MARKLRADDLFGLRFVSDPQVSPDGRTAAAVVTSVVLGERGAEPRYRSRIHLFTLPVAAKLARQGKGGWPRPLLGEGQVFTRSEYRDTSPRFSPDGRHLAFLSVRTEGERPQLYVIPLEGGEARRLTDYAAGVQEFAWHPSGQEVYFLSRGSDEDDRSERGHPLRVTRMRYRGDNEGYYPPTRANLYVARLSGEIEMVKAQSERAQGLTFGPDPDVLYLIRPGGEADESDFRADVVALDLERGSERVVVTGLRGLQGVSPSPDGETLAVTAAHREEVVSHAGVLLFDARRDRQRHEGGRLISGDVDVSPAEAGDSRYGAYPNKATWTKLESGEPALLVNAHVDGVTGLGLLGLDGSLQRLQAGGEPRAVTAFALAPGGSAVFVAESPVHPGELWYRDSFGLEARLSGVNDAWCAELQLHAPEGPLQANGHGVRYWAVRPRRARRDRAAVLQVHGGPHTAYGNGFVFEFQVLASHGYAVLYGNPRGSTGLGHDFAANVLGDYGGEDAQDVLDIADAGLAALGTPKAPLHLTGGSYGGFMTNWLVGVTDRFRSAVSQRSISNWTSMYGTSDIGPSFVERELGANPWGDFDALWRQSPLRNAANVRTPLLLIHSEHDWRCPIEQAEQFFSALKRIGQAEVELLRFPDEGHELSRSGRPDRRLLRLNAIVGWFEAHP